MQKGYTLVELTIVMGIIGTLLTLSIPAFNSFISPQQSKTVMQQVKSELRQLQNKATNGIAAPRLIDSSGDGYVTSLDQPPKNVRVYWVARFNYNSGGSSQYETASCQLNETAVVLGTESESWSECKQKETIRLQNNVKVTSCVVTEAGCTNGSYVVYFTPINGDADIFSTVSPRGDNINITPPNPDDALEGPLRLKFSSGNNISNQYMLILNSDGSITESCTSNGAQVKCD